VVLLHHHLLAANDVHALSGSNEALAREGVYGNIPAAVGIHVVDALDDVCLSMIIMRLLLLSSTLFRGLSVLSSAPSG
jgi:hypothetical protein